MWFIPNIYAQAPGAVKDIVGEVTNPLLVPYGPTFASGGGQGAIILFLTNILRLLFVGAGIYALFNFILAGFQFMTAGGDSKAITAAWAKIWQTLLGLVLITTSFAFAVLFGYLFFGDPTFILSPKIYGP